ncbi:TonB-dependent receptor [Pedobacter sp. Hv1]|uniref:TonB-dependent receptor n=1 Tax=Pedobacter sp. Hv1 TaxID=1740090 RepID=UPI0006D8D468|nr:TonB-dependent receptor [Pedobacter sp. Hv1]KQC00067.1 hypothetical protein AQF98_13960 [Pedobacter sp. Hv1]
MAIAQVQPKSSTIKINDALDKVAKIFQVHFIYESSLLANRAIMVENKALQHKKLETVLSALLEPLEIGYYRVDNANYALFRSLGDNQKSEGINLPNLSNTVENDAATIRGQVRDQSNQPLAYCTVSLLGKDSVQIANAIADSVGRYRFKNISAGNYKIRATRIGYQLDYSEPFQFVQGGNLVLKDLILVEVPKLLAQISFSADKPLFEYKADKTTVNLEGGFIGNSVSISDLLEISPGVTITNDQISLKGKQGVTVTIDGRPVKLSSAQVVNLLRAMPTIAVSQIELIHSPSAKYDAQGKGGVINIKMVNSEARGLSGTINSVFSVGNHPKFTESASLNYGSKGLNLSANYSYQHFKNSNKFFRDNVINGSNPIAYGQDEKGSSKLIDHNAMLGANYQINHKNAISLVGTMDISNNNSNFYRYLSLNHQKNALPDSSITSLNRGSQRQSTYGLNLNSQHNLGSAAHLLLFNAAYTKYRSTSPDTYQNFYLGSSGLTNRSEENIFSNTQVDLELITAGADYSYPIGKSHQLDAGAKIAFTHSNSKVLFQYGSANAQMFADFARSNSFKYKEKISAVYLNYQGKIGTGTTLQLGVRAENTSYKSASISGDQATHQNYIQIFPNFMLRHGVGNHLLALSYHRRVGRPSYQDLNPFVTYFSPYFYAMGNQFLNPETTHTLEMDYSYGPSLHFSLGYSATHNYLGPLIALDNGSLTMRQAMGNFGSYNTFNLSVAYQKTLLKYWNVNANGSLLYDHYQSEYISSAIGNALFGFSFNILNSFKLSPKLSLEVLNLYQSRRAQLAGTAFGRYRADATLKYSVLNNSASLRLGVSDIFYTYLNQGSNQFLQLYSSYSNRNENRRFHLGFSYSFGSKNIQTNKIQHHQQELDRIKPQK